MSTEQSTLGNIDPNSLFSDVRDYLTGLRGSVRNTLSRLGFDLDWWGKSPFDARPGDDIYVYQFVTAYSKAELAQNSDFGWDAEKGKNPATRGSPSPEVQFKTGIYVVGEPTPDLKRRLRAVDNGRLRTVFNTREYADYMSGFGFSEKRTYTQNDRVTAREVDQKGYGLGVPWFEVEAYDENGMLEGYSMGYLNPFTTRTEVEHYERGSDIPQHEVWKVGARQKHESGDRYQIAPKARDDQGRTTGAKKRAKAAAGKKAVIGGMEVGSILGGGRIRLKTAHKTPSRATYASRSDILDSTGIPYQALSEGANLYKVSEDDTRVVFSTKPPRDFDAPEPEDISPDAVGVETGTEEVTSILLDDDEPTTFHIEEDETDGRLLGLYNVPPTITRNIETGTEFVFEG